MNIVLTQEDADWVANVIREIIKELQESYDSTVKEAENNFNACNMIVDKLAEISTEQKDIDETRAELIKVRNDSKAKFDVIYNEKMNTYCKVLELLMCGSEE